MEFLDREDELGRLGDLAGRRDGGLAVVHGRRRVGKTRLLLEWVRETEGIYFVADLSAPDVQRRHLARVIAERFPGFADVEYPDWRSLLDRLAADADRKKWRGPFILDELPYLVMNSPELPSVLQNWIDHPARQARLVVAIAGSSQRMMQGIVLGADAPLFGRATEVLEAMPLPAGLLQQALGLDGIRDIVAMWTAWGGIPRYWELAHSTTGSIWNRIDALVLDPLGPLHNEPDRLLIEELPPAQELRPLLDAIGGGANRVSEIAGRIGRSATSLSRSLTRLQELHLVSRETPFGENERRSKRSLYRISDNFTRMWFRAVAPNRSILARAEPAERIALLKEHWPGLASAAWEGLCRDLVARMPAGSLRSASTRWQPAGRWWHGNAPEWDLVSMSADGNLLLLGEARWSAGPVAARRLERAAREVANRPPPKLPPRYASCEIIRALLVPEAVSGVESVLHGVQIVQGSDLLGI